MNFFFKILFIYFLVVTQVSNVAMLQIFSNFFPSTVEENKALVTSEESLLYRYCDAPQQLESGRFHLLSQNTTKSFKTDTKFPSETKLLLKCYDKYKLEGSSEMICNKGSWSTVGTCLKTCLTLNSSPTMDVTCTYNNTVLINCTEPIDGTVAKFKCSKDTHEISTSSNSSGHIRVCVEGEWHPKSIPECIPKCGYQYNVLYIDENLNVRYYSTNSPWHVGIIYIDLNNNNTAKIVCGGTLIGPRTIITAASCIDTKKILNYRVVASFFLYDFVIAPPAPKEHQIKRIERIINSDRYKPNTYESDLAIIIIKEPFEIGSWVQPICIDGTGLLKEKTRKRKTFISSWRPIKEQHSIPPWQQKVKIISNKKCFKNFTKQKSNYYSSDKICASSLSKDSSVCGQTGNGLIYHHQERYYLIGVASGMPQSPNTQECEDRGFGIFTEISTFTEKLLEIEARYEDY